MESSPNIYVVVVDTRGCDLLGISINLPQTNRMRNLKVGRTESASYLLYAAGIVYM